jgi:hypothetical protein
MPDPKLWRGIRNGVLLALVLWALVAVVVHTALR